LPSRFAIISIKLSKENVLRKNKVGWGVILGVLFLVAACVAAYNITKLPEKNVRLPIVQNQAA
jgi:uncharacterized membrane protein YhdT